MAGESEHPDECLETLKAMRYRTYWPAEEQRLVFLGQLYSLIRGWKGQLPNLRDVFRREEIDWLLVQDVFNETQTGAVPLIDFVIRTGYKDEPYVDAKDRTKPSSVRKHTPLHLAARRLRTNNAQSVVMKLFQIYDSYELNCSDEFGYTHFHAACEFASCGVVEKFLEVGQGFPNLLVPQTGDSPLHLALSQGHDKRVKALLRFGADPNAANKDGSTPLHFLCQLDDDVSAGAFFKLSDELKRPLRVNARDKLGRTPLHRALPRGRGYLTELLMNKGADPNAADKNGSTPLHLICDRDAFSLYTTPVKISHLLKMLQKFFKTAKDQQPVKVDARDKLGRTPLQLAVASLLPNLVKLLLNNGANLSGFVFPSENYFAVKLATDCTLEMVVFPTMSIVGYLEMSDYELDYDAALTIMKTFVKHGLIDESTVDLGKILRSDENFARAAKRQMVSPSLTLHDFLLLPHERAKEVFAIEDYDKFVSGISHLQNVSRKAFIFHLCEIVTRGFFESWALKLYSMKNPFLEECECEAMIKRLQIKDLWNICVDLKNESTKKL